MVTFRVDDIGASAKHFNQHGKKVFRYRGYPIFYWPLSNVGFFKRIWPFKKWAVYDELTAGEWQVFLDMFKERGIKPVVSITAAWVDLDGNMTPFPQKFPDEAAVLRSAADSGDIIIANHGLTHCVVGKHRPSFWRSNRMFFREFYDWVPKETQREHIIKSQEILENYFGRPITIFVPPGHIWCNYTYEALLGTNVKTVIANRYMMDSVAPMNGIEFKDDTQDFFNFHDRELKLFGAPWLKMQIDKYANS